ncbi:hypothetical protein A2814_02030 [Candidatus Nomurabacteria bacterium RIFCSPHIGHO2_01_FULL_38_19]|uniref:Uncharacterized protein n=1 Tax=Candidatus Nomurabacteria bacterium RIFCSPHIGHO2_01_FULL_38_19 TaxID=1801732 RepID=A0A1F6UUP7_9BACT|nr:MAG: hypothetical protein A2814_02030 [Candidatus Nomurabacteria bacterium RIFCSPHIGHO2_01_FULL_38_19]
MDQLQRDLTYRLDAVKQICNQYGQESDMCQQSMQLWESQHSMNTFNTQVLFYLKLTGSILIIFIVGFFIYSSILKSRTQKDQKQLK